MREFILSLTLLLYSCLLVQADIEHCVPARYKRLIAETEGTPFCPPPSTKPSRVIDGDSLKIGKENIRLLGIDAPETRGAKCAREKMNGQLAKKRLKHLLEKANVVVIRKDIDRYGRSLAVVLVDGKNLSDLMLRDGFARPYRGGKRKSWCE